jgi:hypothetical protein
VDAFTKLFGYAAQVEAYKAKIDVYNKMVDNATHANDALRYSMTNFINQPPRRAPVAEKIIFTVYSAANGFYAKIPGGQLVVGMTLSEVCASAQAAAAEKAITADEDSDDGDDPLDNEEDEETRLSLYCCTDPAGSGTQKEHTMATANAPKLGNTDDVNKVRTYIKKLVEMKFGTMTAYAEKEQVSLQYISNVMSGNKPIPDWMLKRFKITHNVVETWEGPKAAEGQSASA